MEQQHILRAGAGRAVIEIEKNGCLPVEGFTSVHDDLHVRALVLDTDTRTVIISVEISTLFDEVLEKMLGMVCEICQVEESQVWMTSTHSFAGPHLWLEIKPGEADYERPGHKPRSPEEMARCSKLHRSYEAALEQACRRAMASLKPAVVGWNSGECMVAASRNILTRDGWWQGTDSQEFCDKTLSLLRVDALSGEPIAALFVYGIRSCVMNRISGEDGGTLISADLCGGACNYLEQQFDGDFTALFLCGAACDQEPALKGNYTELDKDGNICQHSFGLQAEVLLAAQSVRLGSDALKIWREVDNLQDISCVRTGYASCVCAAKKMNGNLRELKPTRSFEFEPNGEIDSKVSVMAIGDFYLAGMQPEMGGITSTQIREAFPDKTAAMAIIVNGSGKCLPDESAYSDFKYQSQNTPFMPGSAEKLRDTAIGLLKKL